jgi:hypothetical protein
MATSHFSVFISGNTGSVEDWQKAMNAPKNELPKLSEEQREVARKMGMSAEEYARGVLVGQYGERRERERGERLGDKIATIISGLGEPYRLEAVIREGVKARWVARITTDGAPKNIAIGLELADDLIESGTVQDEERLRLLVLQSLGRMQ